MAQVTIGIRREDKSEQERRVALTPESVKELIHEHGLFFEVESSKSRIFSDDEYRNAGANVVDELSDVHVIIGLKEIPLSRFHTGKPHLFFSHTIKGQDYNMPLLQRALDEKITLMDYELIKDDKGRRLILFGFQAGQGGMINSIWSLGQRWKSMGIANPFEDLRQARTYSSLAECKKAISNAGKKLETSGLPDSVPPIVVGITGYGSVSKGAQDVLDCLNPIDITPEDLLNAQKMNSLDPRHVYKVVFMEKDTVEPRSNDDAFELQDYFDHPEKYQGVFNKYLKSLTILVNAVYWTPDYPVIVSKKDIAELLDLPDRRLTVIGDVTCDIEGSIECTLRASLPDNPVYVYNADRDIMTDGFDGPGLQMMTVDILPSELPRESSIAFSDMLAPFIPEIARTDFSRDLDELNIPAPFRRCIITHKGNLTPECSYLSDYLPG